MKYTKVKIELFKDITIFEYVSGSIIIGGLCISSPNIADNDNGKSSISSCDNICSLYPYIMTQKLPIGNYKFISNFDKNKYGQNKSFGCSLNVEIYTTAKVRNNKSLSQFPALISKAKITNDDLPEYQKN